MDEKKKTLDEIFGDEEMYDMGGDDDVASFPFDGCVVKQEQEEQLDVMNQEIWGLEEKLVEEEQDQNQDILPFDLNEFYSTDFSPQLPLLNFPCMSSSSSTSSTPLLAKAISVSSTSSSSSSSSDAYWAVWKSESEDKTRYHLNHNTTITTTTCAVAATAATSLSSTEYPIPPPLDGGGGGDIDCFNVMDDFGYLDLVDDNDMWDPSSIFEESGGVGGGGEEKNIINLEEEDSSKQLQEDEELNDGLSFVEGNSELSAIFLDWLKQNKDYISAQDMRSIKLKRSTLEKASNRLGNSTEGQKQLLKLILQWVELRHIQKKKGTKLQTQQVGLATTAVPSIQNPNFNSINHPITLNPQNNPFSNYSSSWIQPPVLSAPTPVGYVCDPTQIPGSSRILHGTNKSYFPMEYIPMDFQKTWPGQNFAASSSSSQFNPISGNGNLGVAAVAAAEASDAKILQMNLYTDKVFDDNGERLVKLGPSASKEARKIRMARNRRVGVHHSYHKSHNNHQNQAHDQLNAAGEVRPWINLSTTSPSPSLVSPLHQHNPQNPGVEQPQTRVVHRNRQQRIPSWLNQGYAGETNKKFLLQKVLKQSDVGALGRIVLPKKEAEMHLPVLENKDNVLIAFEDISTSQVWMMRYRFWPNNNSRMYLLENTGEFVRKNDLKEGDFIVLYSDTKSDKYLIRGVKVHPPEPKSEHCKKPAKKRRNTPQGTNKLEKEDVSSKQLVKVEQISSSSSSK